MMFDPISVLVLIVVLLGHFGRSRGNSDAKKPRTITAPNPELAYLRGNAFTAYLWFEKGALRHGINREELDGSNVHLSPTLGRKFSSCGVAIRAGDREVGNALTAEKPISFSVVLLFVPRELDVWFFQNELRENVTVIATWETLNLERATVRCFLVVVPAGCVIEAHHSRICFNGDEAFEEPR